jgi:hypothetical protein
MIWSFLQPSRNHSHADGSIQAGAAPFCLADFIDVIAIPIACRRIQQIPVRLNDNPWRGRVSAVEANPVRDWRDAQSHLTNLWTIQ